MSIVISSGHGSKVRGAKGYLDEVDEARKVVEKVADFLRTAKVGVKTFHDNTSTSQNQNLQTIVNYHNAQTRDLDVSVHFNAYQTTSKAMGTEVLWVTQQTLATNVSKAIAAAGKFINRGPKKRTDLYFLNKTTKPAILIEVCFVDSSADANLYRQNFDAICKSIAESISGKVIPQPPVQPPVQPVEPPYTEDNIVGMDGVVEGDVTVYVNNEMLTGTEGGKHVLKLKIAKKGDVLIIINGQEFHNFIEEEETKPPIPANQTDIICTVFGGAKDPNNSAYPPYDAITDTEVSVALPFKFRDVLPKVKVINRANKKEVICNIRDVGPWLIDDNYWDTGERPLAEICWRTNTPLPRGPNQGKVPNGAGIDITPGAAKAIDLVGKGNVDWEFVSEPPAVA